MWTIGNLSFAAPWALAALVALPALWWLLRITPPTPRRMVFPPLRLLLGLAARDETAAKSPLWLVALRLLLVALLIAGISDPILNAARSISGGGPLVLIVDDGWAAARDWNARRVTLVGLIDQAGREGRPVMMLTTAPSPVAAGPPVLMRAEDARPQAEALLPKPWATMRNAALERLQSATALSTSAPGEVVWLTDGLADDSTPAWVDALKRLGPLRVVDDAPGRPVIVARPPEPDGEKLRVTLDRDVRLGAQTAYLRAYDSAGTLVARQPVQFAAGATSAETLLDLPSELRNRLLRLEVEDQGTAGSVVLLDERWRRRPVGLDTGPVRSDAQPLLSEFHYLQEALDPFTEVRRGPVTDLLNRNLALLVVGDSVPLTEAERRPVTDWVDAGGILIRFAGPRLADEAGSGTQDPLLPVPLRQGERTLGGAMSWSRPAHLAGFSPDSPFAGLAVPRDVTVSRQVLAQPALDLANKTWARLTDGTPLVTADKRGRGWVVLIHTSATPEWSNLPISGLFVQMLRRIVGMSRGAVAKAGGAPLPPFETLDGFGRLGQPPAGAIGLAGDKFATAAPGPEHPPGFYGNADSRRAFNLSATLAAPRALGPLGSDVTTEVYGTARHVAFQPWLLGAAMILALIDLLISLWLRGLLRLRPVARAGAAVLLLAMFAAAARPASAQVPAGDEAAAKAASLVTRLAYVETGDPTIDGISKAGLMGLSVIANRRTAVDLASPVGVNPEVDELIFYPLIYWPLTDRAPPSTAAAARIQHYMDAGGVILFDARDPNGLVSTTALKALAARLRLPTLNPLPPDHVLTRSYYLLRDFPGRWAGGTVWIESAGERVNDGVSPVIVGSNDWAGAWAMDELQQPLYPVVPGGERQREMAYRFGINVLMYALTGNYKGDQVHLPAILQRLGL